MGRDILGRDIEGRNIEGRNIERRDIEGDLGKGRKAPYYPLPRGRLLPREKVYLTQK